MEFRDQLKASVNIVNVVGQYVSGLRKSGRDTYIGLCPFHQEKTPSFNVHEARQFYHCFGCHASGDVFKFVMEIEGISFFEAMKTLAERHGIAMPKRSQYADEDARMRGALFAMHEIAQEHFRANLASSAGEAARAYLERRGVTAETAAQFGLGLSLATGRALLRLFEERQFPGTQMVDSGLIAQREGGGYYDRFRNRLMFPIHNQSGKIIAYGGRALDPDEKAKYLNSPETPIYKKSHTLYNLHRAKDPIRREERAILVEGYMDAIGVTAAGIGAVVASCGTALTTPQIQALKTHARRIVVNFDPDSAGAKGAERSIDLLLAEGMQVRIMELDGGLDPDEYCRDRGADAYRTRLDQAKGYFYWLADGARRKFDMRTPEGKISTLQYLLPAVQKISDRLERMTIANDVAGYLGVEKSIVLDTFLRSASGRSDNVIVLPKTLVRADERGLVNVILSGAEGAEQLVEALAEMDLDALSTRAILRGAVAAHAAGEPVTFDAVNGRLDETGRNMLAEILFGEDPAASEFGIEWGSKCLERLQAANTRQNATQLKARINEAERAGNLEEAMRLMGELTRLERTNSAPRRGVQ
jgi:DNA primase